MLETIKQWAVTHGATAASKILFAVILIAVGVLVIRLAVNLLNKALEKSKMERAAHSLIRSLVKAVLYVLLALSAASALGIDVTGIIALASVLSLAISLSVQNALSNVIGGFTLLYNHPFHSGDYVEVAGQSGTVTEIGMTYTKLLTPDNKVVSIPNNAVVSAQIVNYSSTGSRRLDINVTASYDSPIPGVISALLKAAEDDRVLQDPAPFAALTGYGDSSIAYTLRVWVKSEDYWDVNFLIYSRLDGEFKKAGAEMNYPHLNVHLEK